MKPYTVLILRPEYTTDNFGRDVYLDWVWAENAKAAGSMAQKNAAQADEQSDDWKDYDVLVCFDGHLEDQTSYD